MRGGDKFRAWEVMYDLPNFRRNACYLDNTNDYLSRTGKSKQQFLDDLDNFDGPKETFFDELKDTPAGGTYADFPTGVWNENPFVRGNALEDVATIPGSTNQLQTPETLPVYDYYDDANRIETRSRVPIYMRIHI